MAYLVDADSTASLHAVMARKDAVVSVVSGDGGHEAPSVPVGQQAWGGGVGALPGRVGERGVRVGDGPPVLVVHDAHGARGGILTRGVWVGDADDDGVWGGEVGKDEHGEFVDHGLPPLGGGCGGQSHPPCPVMAGRV